MSTQILSRSERAAPRRWSVPEWAREPLLHFLLLGALLFAVDWLVVAREDDPRTIVVTEAVEAEARDTFRASRGRDPDAKEMNALRRNWLDNEILYREGLAMQVDRGDVAIRERVIFKALSVIQADLKPPPADERVLREWFEKNRAKYDVPARFDFEEAVLAGEAGESRVRDFVARLNAGEPGDAEAGLRVFRGRPHATIVAAYGDEFATALEGSSTAEWRALRSRDAWHAVRLRDAAPAQPARFEELRGVVLQDWTDEVMAELRTAAVRARGERYTVRYADGAR